MTAARPPQSVARVEVERAQEWCGAQEPSSRAMNLHYQLLPEVSPVLVLGHCCYCCQAQLLLQHWRLAAPSCTAEEHNMQRAQTTAPRKGACWNCGQVATFYCFLLMNTVHMGTSTAFPTEHYVWLHSLSLDRICTHYLYKYPNALKPGDLLL